MQLKPNAGHELLLEAGATQERTLYAVSSMPLLGGVQSLTDYEAGTGSASSTTSLG